LEKVGKIGPVFAEADGHLLRQENAMKGLEGKKIFGHQNCQKSEFDDSRS
jgi:hypothetical protein